MRTFIICMTFLLTWLPSLAIALTMEELVATLDEKRLEQFEDISPEYHSRLLATFTYALEISDPKNRGRAIRRILNFYESPEMHTAEQLLKRFERYGVEISQNEIDDLYDFAVAQEIEFERQILETTASIENIEAETARMREENAQREERISLMQARLSEMRASIAETEAHTAEVEAHTAEMEAEIIRLRRIRANVEAIISELEARN